jgi:polyhydroxybutyrate depolymerase
VEVVALNRHGADRRYLLFPQPLGDPTPRPLVVFLPGTGGTAEWAADEVRLPAFAAAAGFVLVVPEALPPDQGKPPKFLTNPPRWNDGAVSPTSELRADADDVGFLLDVMTDVEGRLPVDPRRVNVAGFSNGAGMTFRLAAEHAERIAAIAPVAGYCWTTAKPRRPVPTLYLIGDSDPLVPLRGGEVKLPWGNKLVRRSPVSTMLENWAAAIGCEPASVVESDAGGVRVERYAGEAEFLAVTVAGLGHHWPGGKGQLNPRIGGPLSARVDANSLIWEFFRRHSL